MRFKQMRTMTVRTVLDGKPRRISSPYSFCVTCRLGVLAEGTVRVAVGPGAPGKIRTRIRGDELDLIALPAGDETLPPGTPVMIIEMEGAVARIVRRDAILGD